MAVSDARISRYFRADHRCILVPTALNMTAENSRFAVRKDSHATLKRPHFPLSLSGAVAPHTCAQYQTYPRAK